MAVARVVQLQPVPLLFLNQAIVGGQTLSQAGVSVLGLKRVVGVVHLAGGSVGAAAGFPRVSQVVLGTVASFTVPQWRDTVPQDPTQGAAGVDFIYRFDVEVVGEYLSIDVQNGAVAGTIVAWAMGLPE